MSRAPLLLLALIAPCAIAQPPPLWHGTPPRTVERLAPPPGRTTAPAVAAPSVPVRPTNEATPPALMPEGEHAALGRLLARKFANPDYAAALESRKALPATHQMPEEAAVRRARAKFALARRPPPGAQVLSIPLTGTPPTVDGVVRAGEWSRALRLAAGPGSGQVEFLLTAHAGQLYLAALAPADRTADGFDQFRFWYHIELSPYLENERAFVTGHGRLTSLRGARLPRDGTSFPDAPSPQSLAPKTDWNIYAAMRGASAMEGYRQYEMALELAEAGIPRTVVFPAWLEVEGDPIMDAAGKFKSRVILGQVGSAKAPLWLRIGP